MFGLFVELGPYVMNQNSLQAQGPPTLFDNPYAWTKSGSVLMFDWAPPVGFSYCNDDPKGDGFACGAWDDERMATLSYAALAGWFFDLDKIAFGVLVLQVATPVAVTSYLLAEKYGADAQSVAGLVVVSTVLSVAALPLMLGFLL